jgi:glycosyltransferase involved in cell wall biosynthesis
VRILYAASYSPWPTVSGGAWRSFRILERLAREHAVVAALCTDDAQLAEPFLAENPLELERRLLAPDGAPDGEPRRFRHEQAPPELRGRWRRALLETVDDVEPDLVWFSELSPAWRCGPLPTVPVVTDLADVQVVKEARTQAAALEIPVSSLRPDVTRTDLLLRRGLRVRTRLARGPAARVLALALAERSVARASNAVCLANEQDVPYLAPLAETVVVPNGFDFRDRPTEERRPEGTTLVFFGLLTYRPNLDGLEWFCARIWPSVLARRPEARLEIVGEHDGRLSFAASVPGATVHGFVPDLAEVISRSSALVVPLRSGGGTRLKILEAWARRLPVVSTSVGCEGLGARDGVELLVADAPSSFAAACVRLLEDDALGHRLAAAAFRHGGRRFDWSEVLDGVDLALERATADLSGRARRGRPRGRRTTPARAGPGP